MAEVLITLGIIGVVAALTMPTLIANYRNQAYVTQLKKTVSMLEQGFKQALADEGVDSLSDTTLFSTIDENGNGTNLSDLTSDSGKKFVEGMKKYFNIIESGKGDKHNWNYLTYAANNATFNNCQITFVDGSMLGQCYFYKKAIVTNAQGYQGNILGYQGTFYIDVNGDKKPNVVGKDIYAFYLAENGHLMPMGGIEFRDVLFAGHAPYWRDDTRGCGEPGKKVSKDANINGYSCAARIIENGWKIDYL